MSAILQHVVDAVALGSLYALTALGIGLIFGVMRLINFAHGDFIMGAPSRWSFLPAPRPRPC